MAIFSCDFRKTWRSSNFCILLESHKCNFTQISL